MVGAGSLRLLLAFDPVTPQQTWDIGLIHNHEER